jgi:hypothetical protein
VRALIAAVAAAALWLIPLPASFIERWYSRGVYLVWQRIATGVSNFVPFAIFDLLLVACVLLIVFAGIRARRERSWRLFGTRVLLIAAVAALWFQLAWGLNYRRMPIAETMGLAVTAQPGALERFALAAADAVAASADQLDRENPMTSSRVLAEVTAGFERAQHKAGLPRMATAGRAKRSLLDLYFRSAAVDGLTNPFVPETIVVSGLTPAETYMTVAHEWAHLAGYASEDEANFIGWISCLESGGGARYNAWLFALMKAARSGTPAERRAWFARAGPVAARDLQAIRVRVQRSSPAVRQVASATYDQFLRANRVESGIDSYDEVLRLMLAYGTGR